MGNGKKLRKIQINSFWKKTMKDEAFFVYGEKQISFLKARDKRLGEVIDKVGHIERQVIPDLFSALVHSIVGQQISSKAHSTIWQRMTNEL